MRVSAFSERRQCLRDKESENSSLSSQSFCLIEWQYWSAVQWSQEEIIWLSLSWSQTSEKHVKTQSHWLTASEEAE